ncbi:MAG: hypothetical protein KC620_03805 [Myxococcales bacterium]|nr:hypothetical protein [Myxococcales bacterium]
MRQGDQLGAYRLGEAAPPQEGADAWRAVDAVGCPVIVRVLPIGSPAHFREVMTRVQALAHPALRPIEAYGLVDDRHGFVARPLAPGERLDAALPADVTPPPDVARRIGRTLLDALVAAHAQGLVHGRVGPEAIWWREGQTWLGDLGFAAVAPDALPISPIDDLRGVTALLRRLIPDPSNSLRLALLGPPTSAAELRAALEGGDETPAAAPGDDWGVESPIAAPPKPAGRSWVVDQREFVQASSAPAGESDGWGLTPQQKASAPTPSAARDKPGPAVHRVQSAARAPVAAKPRSPVQLMVIAGALLVVGLVAARVILNMARDEAPLPEPTVPARLAATIDAEPPTPDAAPAAVAGDGGSATDAGSDMQGQGAEGESVVLVIAPEAADVIRVKDKFKICVAARECRVPIDVDYRVVNRNYAPLDITGDDLYDRRTTGRWRVVLPSKEAPPPRERRRRRQ